MLMPVDRPPTVSHATADAIREAIFRGEFKLGEPLKEIDLSNRLKVSRGTVREAFRLLVDERLVEITPRFGARVSCLSPKIAEDLYKLRAVLETLAVRLAMEKDGYTEACITSLIELAHRLDHLEKNHVDVREAVNSELTFHKILIEGCDNELLLDELKRLQSMTWLFMIFAHQYWSSAYLQVASHLDIAEAIQQKDVKKAVELLGDHINNSGKTYLEQLSSQSWESLGWCRG